MANHLKVPTPAELRRWQEDLGLTDWQVGYMARVSVIVGVGAAAARAGKGRRVTQCATVQRWHGGTREIPLATWELLQVKGMLLRRKVATYEELSGDLPLAKLLEMLVPK